MRIVMTSDGAGGVGVHAETLAAALRRRGHEVTLVQFAAERALSMGQGADSNAPTEMATLRRGERLEWESTMDVATLAKDADSGRAFLAHLVQSTRADVLHCNQFEFSGAAAPVPTLLAVHSDVVSWWRAVHGTLPPDNAFQRWYWKTVETGIQRASAMVAPTAATVRDLRASYAIRSEVEVIANGAPARATNLPWSARMGAVAVGRWWDAAKQAAMLLRSDLGMPLTLLGDGAPAETGIADIRCRGRLPQEGVRAVMARSWLFVSASRYEPFGLAALEAAQAGCCLLLNDIPSAREVWAETAFYFRSGDAMAATMRQLAMESQTMQRMGASARTRAAHLYGEHAMALRYESLYARLRQTTRMSVA